ncbi:hypothetical protein ACP70R_003777 [Stipagrostis hirtigluma subsp. patula]
MKITTIVQFLLVLVACSKHAVTCISTYANDTDRLSLLEFKKAISIDPQQALMSWNESIHFCHWEGIRCRTKHPHHVTSIHLENRGFVGQISPSLGNLTFLKTLSLSANRFTGQIPSSLGHLHRLQSLSLSNNMLQGIIPSFANCSNLQVLWLNGNNLAGRFPSLPPQLQDLRLAHNSLNGVIPSSLANVTTLKTLNCMFNNIKGNIPNEFAKLPGLQILYSGCNQLAGRFPQAVLNLSTLVVLGLNTNNLSGKVPSDLGNSLPNLELLFLDMNSFHGHIPTSLTNASSLYYLDMSNNSFTGVVPSSIGKLSKLSKLNFELNKLQAHNKQEWEFMNSLGNCTKLEALSIAMNKLEGPVPSSLGNLSIMLRQLYLGNNQLTGGFPSSIENLANLIFLGLEGNRFTGVVPDWLGSLKTLQGLNLYNNMFTGPIPPSLSNLSHLFELFLCSNQFTGQIPTSLGNLQNLALFNISNNNLHGRIPKEIFGIPTMRLISISFNNLDGTLPTESGNAKQLIYLELSSNKLSGEVPSTLGDCESLEGIEIGHNVFNGSIPTSLGNIRTLKFLNLSHNNLTGLIPASLGNLHLLEQLDLSFNHLEGEVPAQGIFKNATAMWIYGNQELCGGPLELHLPSCFMRPLGSAVHKRSVVLKVVIPIAIMLSLGAMIFVKLIWCKRKQKRKSFSFPSFARELPKISYNDLVKATEGFSTSNLIGKGRYGSVYQGTLFQDGNMVAIKVFSLETRGAQKSFIAECNALRNVRHRNLVPILTACSSIDYNGNDFKALVYKFMSGGDLHNLLYLTQDSRNSSYSNNISLAQRLSILVDVSDALAYLHHNHQQTIVHCDLKPRNILLDNDMVAHLGDFGLAKFKIDSSSSSVNSNSTPSVAIKGTIGYVAPGGGQVSTAMDVYSFGVVLLEIFIRKRPTDDMFKDGMNIAKFTEINFPDNVLQIVDPQLLEELVLCQETPMAIKDSGIQCLQSVLNIGLHCTKSSPSDRMSMQDVAAKLHRTRDAYLKRN